MQQMQHLLIMLLVHDVKDAVHDCKACKGLAEMALFTKYLKRESKCYQQSQSTGNHQCLVLPAQAASMQNHVTTHPHKRLAGLQPC
jgi:hypothetical protein